jgi:hypothetical protein
MITHEYPPILLGGVATHVQQLARGLVSAGHIVHVLSETLILVLIFASYNNHLWFEMGA